MRSLPKKGGKKTPPPQGTGRSEETLERFRSKLKTEKGENLKLG